MRRVLRTEVRHALFGGILNGETRCPHDGQAMGGDRAAVAARCQPATRRSTVRRPSRRARRSSLGSQDGSALARPAGGVSRPVDLPEVASTMARARRGVAHPAGVPLPVRRMRSARPGERVHRPFVRLGTRTRSDVGTTKAGKGIDLIVAVHGKGVPLGVAVASASPAEVTLVPQVLNTIAVDLGAAVLASARARTETPLRASVAGRSARLRLARAASNGSSDRRRGNGRARRHRRHARKSQSDRHMESPDSQPRVGEIA